MTYQELINRLEAIKKELCPTTPEDWQRAIDSNYQNVCGCHICTLTRDLFIAEIQGWLPVTDMPGVRPAEPAAAGR